MKVVVCWSTISGYMAACWRALAQRPGIDLFVLARSGNASNVAFDQGVMRGITFELLPSEEDLDESQVRSIVVAQKPDIVAINGWHLPAYTKLPFVPELASCRFVMAIDTPRKDTLRQRVGRWYKKSYFDRLDYVFTAGERSWELAKLLGFPEQKIGRGTYAADFEAFKGLYDRRMALPKGWPRRFVYTGRYVDEKAIDVMIEGYRLYRKMVDEPWPLTCCGRGPWGDALRATPGVEDRGFVQPDDLPAVLLEAGAFVLASRYEPWGVVIAEAAAAGLPIICTEAVSSRIELVRHCYNGRTVATDQPFELAKALRYMHRNYERLPAMGLGSRAMAEPFSAEMWAERWHTVFDEITEGPNPSIVNGQVSAFSEKT